jgi:hypothetical protein
MFAISEVAVVAREVAGSSYTSLMNVGIFALFFTG